MQHMQLLLHGDENRKDAISSYSVASSFTFQEGAREADR